ncbi:MAG TPA: hypothetical protein VFY49_18295 [Myxococcota bacterium]|nr:hypothetical protein [Myxococcota bacterium]
MASGSVYELVLVMLPGDTPVVRDAEADPLHFPIGTVSLVAAEPDARLLLADSAYVASLTGLAAVGRRRARR